MTMSDNERAMLAGLSAKVDALAEDVAEIKDILKNVINRGDSRHEKIAEDAARRDARIAVLEANVQKLEKALWATGGVGASALLGHAPSALALLGG